MGTAKLSCAERLAQKQAKWVRSLRAKKYRQQEKAFLVEGAKNVLALLSAHYKVRMVIGTASFVAQHEALLQQHGVDTFQVSAAVLANLGTFKANNAALAVASIPPTPPLSTTVPTRTLVLDDIQDPGNLGTIIRTAAWYGIKTLICSTNTVDLYNPKVLHASMGSFVHIQVHYTHLPTYLEQNTLPVVGTFIEGKNIHHTTLPTPGLIVIGNETHGIGPALQPHIQHRVCIPCYGPAASLNAAMATAIVCDHWRR